MSTLSTFFFLPPAADYKTEHSIHKSCSILSPHAKRLPQIGLRLLRPWLCLTWDKTICVFLLVCFHFHPHHARWEKLGLVGLPTSRCWFLVFWLLRWKVLRLPPMSTDQCVYVCVRGRVREWATLPVQSFCHIWFAKLYGFTISKGRKKH